MIEVALEAFKAGLSGIRFIDSRRINNQELNQRKREALEDVRKAAILTKQYIYDEEVRNDANRDREREISNTWAIAASKIEFLSEELFRRTQAKAIGWADPREWYSIKESGIDVSIDAIIRECDKLLTEIR
jgi:hypothetical protein